MDLAVGQPGVIVDDADDLDLAGVARLVLLGAIAVRPVAGPLELRQLEGVNLQKRAGPGPPITARGPRALGATLAADAMTL